MHIALERRIPAYQIGPHALPLGALACEYEADIWRCGRGFCNRGNFCRPNVAGNGKGAVWQCIALPAERVGNVGQLILVFLCKVRDLGCVGLRRVVLVCGKEKQVRRWLGRCQRLNVFLCRVDHTLAVSAISGNISRQLETLTCAFAPPTPKQLTDTRCFLSFGQGTASVGTLKLYFPHSTVSISSAYAKYANQCTYSSDLAWRN